MNKVRLRLGLVARAQHGMESFNPVLLLGAAFFIILGLKHLFGAQLAPTVQTQTQEVFHGGPPTTAARPGASAGPLPNELPDTGPIPAHPMGGAASAEQRLAQLPQLPFLHKAANIGYPPPTDPEELAAYQAIMNELQQRYRIERIDLPETGLSMAVLRSLDPNDPRVLLSFAGTDDWRDLVVDGGQYLKRTTTEEAVAGVVLGAVTGSAGMIVRETGRHIASQYAAWQYEHGLAIVQEHVAKYGRANVTVVGHSLGGGIATYAALMTGVRAIGFNSAPLGAITLDRTKAGGVRGAEQYITHVNAAGEMVSSYAPGRQVGEVITVDGKATGWFRWWSNHYLNNIDITRGVRYQPPPNVR